MTPTQKKKEVKAAINSLFEEYSDTVVIKKQKVVGVNKERFGELLTPMLKALEDKGVLSEVVAELLEYNFY